MATRRQIRLQVGAPINQDAYNIIVLRDEWEEGDEDSLRQSYLDRDGRWISYKGYDILQVAFSFSGQDVHRHPNLKAAIEELLSIQKEKVEIIHEAIKEGFQIRE